MICALATRLARVEQQRRQIMKLQWAECSKTAFSGDFTPVLAEHTRHLILVDILSVGVVAHAKQVEAAKLVIYRAFVSGELDRPKSLARHVQDLY